jgi:hypothetical protein
MSYDVFISHASEDKQTIAIPLSDYLASRGLSVWLDINEISLGDSLRTAIDRGLREAKFGVVILSPAFVAKVWPRRELGALFALERFVDSKVILPVRHNIGTDEILEFSPMLGDRLSVSTSEGIAAIGDAVIRAVAHSGQSVSPPPSPSQQRREETVKALHERLLSAATSEDIRRVILELDVHVERYAQDVDARLLLGRARRAFQREELSHVQEYRKYTLPRHSSILAFLIRVGLIGLLIASAIRWLWSLF